MSSKASKADVFELLFEAAPDALFLINADGLIEKANQQAQLMFAYAPEDLIGKPVEVLIPLESRKIHVAHRANFLNNPTVRKMGSDLRLHGRTSEGNDFPIDVSLSPIEYAGKTMIAAAVRDFTQQRTAEESLRHAKERAQSATESKSRFLAAASHDLRQPLQSLNLYLAVLRRQMAEPAALETAHKMQQSLDAMGELLNSLLDLSRFEGNSIVPVLEEFPVQILLDRLAADAAPIADEKQLHFNIAKSSAVIYSDAALLQRVVENFVTNAIKYTDVGSVSVRCKEKSDVLLIDVCDTGMGIPAAEIDSIFDEYVQLDNAVRDRRKGLGLGLTIARNIARLLNHPISVTSELGDGSIFSIEVPLGDENKKINDLETEESLNELQNTISILLVEDDPTVRDATKLLLETEGHDVCMAVDGEAALEQVQNGARPNLIISDYRLPGADGYEVIRKIRQFFGSELPAILVTGDTTVVDVADESFPSCTVIYKPIDTNALIQLVNACRK